MFQTSINQGSEIISHLNKNTILDSHDKKIKDARQHVDGAMDVLLRILQDSGVAVAAINELRQDVSDGECKRVLHCAQKYLSCTEPCNGASFFVLTGWETLNRLDTLRFRQALKIVRCIILGEKKGNIRRANFNLQIFAEECAASQLGLYKAQTWKHRMEKKGTARKATDDRSCA
mmetsp:Transcript_17819/g.26359  ORF Transcript_17819/g.26359 Transcript_17819/m.26359 type:complete len:175 (-) Transcript_17819:33-557(-)